jgi:hypothetical protein
MYINYKRERAKPKGNSTWLHLKKKKKKTEQTPESPRLIN